MKGSFITYKWSTEYGARTNATELDILTKPRIRLYLISFVSCIANKA